MSGVNCADCIKHGGDWECDRMHCRKGIKQQMTKANDCINRQDAITNMAFAIWHYPNELYTSLNCFENCQELADYALNSLPSAELEIVMCKECKHRGEEPIADGRYWCNIHNAFMYYCSDAERGTDE